MIRQIDILKMTFERNQENQYKKRHGLCQAFGDNVVISIYVVAHERPKCCGLGHGHDKVGNKTLTGGFVTVK